jgi:hypothetical protein
LSYVQNSDRSAAYIKDNKIALKTQLVGVMLPDSGRYAAAILSSENPAKVWQDFELSGGKNKPALLEKTPQPIFSQIQYNQKLMKMWGQAVRQQFIILTTPTCFNRSSVCRTRNRWPIL